MTDFVGGLFIAIKEIFKKKKTINYPFEKMPEIFYRMFQNSSDKIIKFLSNKSNFFDDLSIILKMPKLIFLKALLK